MTLLQYIAIAISLLTSICLMFRDDKLGPSNILGLNNIYPGLERLISGPVYFIISCLLIKMGTVDMVVILIFNSFLLFAFYITKKNLS